MISLGMIVRNEAHCIVETLENLISKVPISSFVICDTGSTDNTKDLISAFFQKARIKGILIDDPWVSFSHNRTRMLEMAYNTSDLLMLFDADDRIVGDLPSIKRGVDKYYAFFGTTLRYERPLFINNRKRWHYVGVLHEYLDANEPRTSTTMLGSYHIESNRTGARNLNPNKYQDDALLLSNAFQEETNERLKARYAFYCGQSFRDAKDDDRAMYWFRMCLDMDGWTQERYSAALSLGIMHTKRHQIQDAIHYFNRTVEYDPSRIEGVVLLCHLQFTLGNYATVNGLYHRFQDYKQQTGKLFVRTKLYDFHLEYYNALSAYKVGDLSAGYACCKRVILHCRLKEYVQTMIETLPHYQECLKSDNNFRQKLRDLSI